MAAVFFYIFNDFIPSLSLRKNALLYNDKVIFEIIEILKLLVDFPVFFKCLELNIIHQRNQFINAFAEFEFSRDDVDFILTSQYNLRKKVDGLYKLYPEFLSSNQLCFCRCVISSSFYQNEFNYNTFSIDDYNRRFYQDNQQDMAESIANLYEASLKVKHVLK